MTGPESQPETLPPGQLGEETVEIEFTATEQLELAGAYHEALRPAPAPSDGPAYDVYVCRRSRRMDFLGTLAFATLIVGITAAFGVHSLLEPSPVALAVPPPAPLSAVVPVRAEPQPSFVQVVNPFDATEVFELPANTTEPAAKAAIADLLLQRARERLRQGVTLRGAGHALPIATEDSAGVFVTRVPDAAGPIADSFSLRAAQQTGE